MAKYRNVYCKIWNDDKFPFASDDCQMVWLHAYTCPFSTGLGIYMASIEALAANKRWPVKRYRKGLAECIAKGFIKYDERYHVVWFPKFLSWNKPANPNVFKKLLSVWDEIPPSNLKLQLFQYLETTSKRWGIGFANVCSKIEKPIPKQEQEQEQEQEKRFVQKSAKSEEHSTAKNTSEVTSLGEEEKFYLTAKGKKLKGKNLLLFEKFWDLFDYKHGKAPAADSWLQIEDLTDDLANKIFSAARQEAGERNERKKSGEKFVPKMAQGWITDRRWEDYDEDSGETSRASIFSAPEYLSYLERRKKRVEACDKSGIKKIDAEWEQRKKELGL
jgi:hypothetical protein